MKTHKQATEAYTAIITRGLMPCFEVETNDGVSVVYIEPSKKGWNVGTLCNVGMLVDFEYIWESCFSPYENLQFVMDEIDSYYRHK
jgi:hypothetical protein